MNILITGGLGFIGSHTAVLLIENGHKLIIADNLSNSKIEVLDRIFDITGVKPAFYKIDVTDEEALETVFTENELDGVIHFAGFKAVGESVAKPLEYYFNNLVSTMNLSKLCLKYGVGKFVFSSSATVYGDQASPLSEDMELRKPENPYGKTKAMSEQILIDTAKTNSDFSVCILRYFNPVGAHESGLLGEDPNGIPNNLMPYITKVAKGELPYLNIFGDDYDTPDGTGIRDYIHVVDLARGHVMALLKMEKGVSIYNLGTGKGTSVLELVNAYMKENGIDIPYKITARRPGDLAICFADANKAKEELSWEAELGIGDMVKSAYRYGQNCK